MRSEFKVQVPAALAAELARAAKAAGLAPARYVDQIVEAWVADLRPARIEDVRAEAKPREGITPPRTGGSRTF